MSSVVAYFGESGAGHLVKTVNNMLLMMNMVCASEAINFALKCGLDEKAALRVMNNGAARSWVLEQAMIDYERDPRDRSTEQSMIAKLGKGNHINWAQDVAREKGIFLPLAALANEVFTCATADKGNTEYGNNIDVLKGLRWQMMVANADQNGLK